MNYMYYIVDKNTMSILAVYRDFVEAYNKAQEVNGPCAVFQGCFLTETLGAQENEVSAASAPDELKEASYDKEE